MIYGRLYRHSCTPLPLSIAQEAGFIEKKSEETVMLDLVQKITKSQLRTDIPNLRPGQTVVVNVRIQEGDKTRVQAFEGVVISRQGNGISENFTVRKVSSGIGVERTFPIHTPIIESVKVLRTGKVRRAKLYYLRSRSGKSARLKEVR